MKNEKYHPTTLKTFTNGLVQPIRFHLPKIVDGFKYLENMENATYDKNVHSSFSRYWATTGGADNLLFATWPRTISKNVIFEIVLHFQKQINAWHFINS